MHSTIRFRRSPLLAVVAAAAAAFLIPASPAAAQDGSALRGDAVAATVDGEPVLLSDVDRLVHDAEPWNWLRTYPAVYEARRAALRRAVAMRGYRAAAELAGVPVESYMDSLVELQLLEPAEGEVDVAERRLARSQPSIPEVYRRDVARLQLLAQQRVALRARMVDEAYRDVEAAGGLDVHLPVPRVSGLGDGSDRPGWGAAPDRAAVTLHVFSDFTCPFCQRIAPIFDRLVDEHPDLRVVFRYFPVGNRPGARGSAESSACAARQGRFDEYHDAIMEDPAVLESGAFDDLAVRLGLDLQAFRACVANGDVYDEVEDDVALGRDLGIGSTPTSFLNGRPFVGARPYIAFDEAVREELEIARSGRN